MISTIQLNYKNLKRTRKVNGLTTIEMLVLPDNENKDYFNAVVEEAVIDFQGDKYVIKKLEEKSNGKTYYKQVTAIHKFYVDLINKQQPTIHNGSITFRNYMNLVFDDMPYNNFEIIGQFNARSFENLGNENRLALLQKGLDRFKAEIELVGSNYKPRLRERIGNDTDFQFRYGHNVKAINVNVDTTNLATKIAGTGDPELNITASYTSPNVTIFGEIDAPPVNDERFKSKATLLSEMKERIIDEPEMSITVDFVDLRAAGYPYAIPNEGDRVWLIYEPMDDLIIETRILEIVEVFDHNEKVIRTEVTLSNHKKSFANTVFDNVRKQLDGIVDNDGIIRYNALDEAVKVATESLQSAQTELEFNNGIIARDKTNPFNLVLFNSNGIGISKDGGFTFQEAITADGFVLSAGAVGELSANHIKVGRATLDTKSDRWDMQGTYINDDGIYTGSLTANQVQLGFNEVGSQVKISAVGLTTYSAGLRTSLLNGSGHRFYHQGIDIGKIGTTGWVGDPNYRGLDFLLENEADSMTWAFRKTSNDSSYTTMLAWHKTSAKANKGFTFSDDVTFNYDVMFTNDVKFSGRGYIKSYNNAVEWGVRGSNYNITQFENGDVGIYTGSSTATHSFYKDGTKKGGSIKLNNERLGMSPVDSPQVLIEYIEFDIKLTEKGTKVYIEEIYLQSVNNFAVFLNNGSIIEKGVDYFIAKGKGTADARIVGKRIEYEKAFWGEMKSKENIQLFSTEKRTKNNWYVEEERKEIYENEMLVLSR